MLIYKKESTQQCGEGAGNDTDTAANPKPATCAPASMLNTSCWACVFADLQVQETDRSLRAGPGVPICRETAKPRLSPEPGTSVFENAQISKQTGGFSFYKFLLSAPPQTHGASVGAPEVPSPGHGLWPPLH